MKQFIRKLCVIGSVMCWQASSATAADDIDLQEVVQGIFVSQGLHEQMTLSNQGAIGNSGFIVGQESVAVIDPGGSLVAGKRLKQAIRHVTDLPIEYLILTHFHPDHVAGAMAFADTSTVIAHENYARAMTQRAQFFVDRFPDILPGSVAQVFRVPTRMVAVGSSVEIDLGHRPLSIEAHPLAHTDNDLTVLDKSSHSLWASDLVFAQRTPSLDGSLIGWLQVLAELDAHEYAMTVPGHGTPGDWQDITASLKQYLLALRDDVRTMIKEGTPLSDVLNAHQKSSVNDSSWLLYAAQHASNLAKAYTELEWE